MAAGWLELVLWSTRLSWWLSRMSTQVLRSLAQRRTQPLRLLRTLLCHHHRHRHLSSTSVLPPAALGTSTTGTRFRSLRQQPGATEAEGDSVFDSVFRGRGSASSLDIAPFYGGSLAAAGSVRAPTSHADRLIRVITRPFSNRADRHFEERYDRPPLGRGRAAPICRLSLAGGCEVSLWAVSDLCGRSSTIKDSPTRLVFGDTPCIMSDSGSSFPFRDCQDRVLRVVLEPLPGCG